MKSKIVVVGLVGLLVASICSLVYAQGFTDVATAAHEGKTGLKSLTAAIDSNLEQIENGTAALVIGPVTNVIGSTYSNYFYVSGTTLLFYARVGAATFTNTIDDDILH